MNYFSFYKINILPIVIQLSSYNCKPATTTVIYSAFTYIYVNLIHIALPFTKKLAKSSTSKVAHYSSTEIRALFSRE